MRKVLQATETVPGGLAGFEEYLRTEGWYDWDVLTYDAATHVYEVDADHADFFIEQGAAHGVNLIPVV